MFTDTWKIFRRFLIGLKAPANRAKWEGSFFVVVTREIRSTGWLEARKNCKRSQVGFPCEITNNRTRFREDPSKNRNLFVGH